ncbi:hypothetical protein [Haliangium sp. UPWRP_2]|uniref:hypothetical protein n=1 Tax=Haliangium sp. UPWRP_2 TaxID=1931276 RepID=UPI0011B2749E|nr:hypothetical protein [Haliangium sp. UPWRP_2]
MSRLTVGEMLTLSQPFLDPTHPAYEVLAGLPEVAVLMPRLREVHQVLLASQSADERRAGSLEKEVSALDAEHDDLVSGLDCLFQSARFLIEEEEERLRWEQLHQLLLPDGRKLAHMSYKEEASHAALLSHILAELPEADRNILKRQSMGKRSVYDIVERWIAVGKEIGQKEQERVSVPVTPSDDTLQAAQHQWAKIVGAISAMLQMALILGELPAVLKEHVMNPLRAATERKSLRPTAPRASGGSTPPRPSEPPPQT